MANINGNNNANTLTGTAAADTINGRGGNDTLFGGLGDDTLIGGSGVDTATYDGGAAVNADLTLGVATGQGNDILIEIENLRGSSFNDTLKGNAGNNTIQGGAGADLIIATAGFDTLSGGADTDTVDFSVFTSGVSANLATGAYSSAFGSGQMSGIENLVGSSQNDTLTGNNASNTINGGLGNDILNGGGGIDTLSYAGVQAHNFINLATGVVTQQWSAQTVGTDTVSNFENVIGGDYSDFIHGNAANNVINGGGSSDTLYASMGVDVLDGGTGANDTADFSDVSAVTASLATNAYSIDANNFGTLANIDHLSGSAGSDTLTGDGANNYLMGAAGADVLAGGLGNDELWGGAGSDRLIADGGNDSLYGNYDRLNGFGDYAADIFEIRTNAGSVTIGDFDLGVDKLDLTAFGFDQNGISPYWTGSATATPTFTTLTLTGLNNEVVTIKLQGVGAGQPLSVTDFIGGSASLIPAPLPINGGNGQYDVHVLTPNTQTYTIQNFENGIDQLDVSQVAGWDGYLSTTPQGWVTFNFMDNQGGAFSVTLEGVSIAQIDPSDFIM